MSTGRSALHADRSVATLLASEAESPVLVVTCSIQHFRGRPGCLLQAPNCPVALTLTLKSKLHFYDLLWICCTANLRQVYNVPKGCGLVQFIFYVLPVRHSEGVKVRVTTNLRYGGPESSWSDLLTNISTTLAKHRDIIDVLISRLFYYWCSICCSCYICILQQLCAHPSAHPSPKSNFQTSLAAELTIVKKINKNLCEKWIWSDPWLATTLQVHNKSESKLYLFDLLRICYELGLFVDLLYSVLYTKSKTNRTGGAWT